MGVVGDASADLSWTCTTWSADGWDYGGSRATRRGTSSNGADIVHTGVWGITAYCSSASITGSISASITQADKDSIINGVTGSAVITNITNKVNQAASNTIYNKNGNNWSAARWAAEGYTLTESIINDSDYGLKTISNQIKDIRVAVDSNVPPPFIHSIRGKNNMTATSNGTFTVIVEAQNAVQYRGRYDNSAWTAWTTNKEVVITGIPPGLRTITIEAQNSKGETYSKEMTVFSL